MADRSSAGGARVLVAAVTIALLAVAYGTASRRAGGAPAPTIPATTTTVVVTTTTRPPSPFEAPAGVVRGIAHDGADAVCAAIPC